MEDQIRKILETELLNNDFNNLENQGFFDLMRTNEGKLALFEILAERFTESQANFNTNK